MKLICRIIFILLLFNFPVSAFEEIKPSLGVRFEIKEGLFFEKYGSDGVRWIETEGTKKIVEIFNRYFSFMEFTEIQSENNLIISLESQKEASSSSNLYDVVYHLIAKGDSVSEQIGPINWIFIPKRSYSSPVVLEEKKEGELIKISNSFEAKLRSQRDALVDNIFRNVLLTNPPEKTAHHKSESLIIIMPFNFQIGHKSKFEVCAVYKVNGADRYIWYETEPVGTSPEDDPVIPKIFQRMLETEAKEPSDKLDVLLSGQYRIIIPEVYIIKYDPPKKRTTKRATPKNMIEEKDKKEQ